MKICEKFAAEVINELSNDCNVAVRNTVREVAAKEGYTHLEVLNMLAENWDSDVRASVAHNENVPEELLKKLAEDKNGWVKYNVVCNPSTPMETLKRLCEDTDDDVSKRAKKEIAKIYVNSLSENEKSEFAKAKSLISKYVTDEFNSEADFGDLQHIAISYTEIGSEKQGDFPFQAEADLINCEINYYIDGEIAKTEKYDSLMEMNEQRLSCLDFDDMLHIGTTELDRILAEKEKNAPIKTVLAVSQNDTYRYYVANNVTEDDVKNLIKKSDKLFMDLCALGSRRIDEAGFAQYSQTDGVKAIDISIDEQTMHVYDADKPITSFDDIRSDNPLSNCEKELITQLDDVIATCQKIKDALMTGELDINKNAFNKGIER